MYNLKQKLTKILRTSKAAETRYVFNQEEYNRVLDFYKSYQDFRTDYNCSIFTNIAIDKCIWLKSLCYQNRDLGMYYFADNEDPQRFMREYILSNLPINTNSSILEIGPGNVPVFDFSSYPNWFGIDKFFVNQKIDFNGNSWANAKYPSNKIFSLSWENVSEILTLNPTVTSYDIVVASHSYEHVFEPIKSLLEASKVLKPGGHLVLFVPDGLSDEPAARMEMTHSLYLVPAMLREFFHYTNAFTVNVIESFRPNYDYVIIAQKRSQ